MLATPISRETLLDVVRTLPAAPRILSQLGRMLGDANSELDEITRLLKCDAALTARIIRVSNSVLYNTGAPFASIEEALAHVGFNEAYRLTGFAAAAQLADERLPFYRINGVQLRENSLLTALIMESVAAEAGVDPRLAYTAGLLRSIGKIALDRIARRRKRAGDHAIQEGDLLLDWEHDLAGMGNGDIAAVILREWRFPEVTIEAIRDQYLVAPTAGPLAHLLNLAAGMAERCGFGLEGESRYVELQPSKYAAAEVSVPMVEDSVVRAFETFYRICETVG
jgi:HD-like signal output (HDOD) protein